IRHGLALGLDPERWANSSGPIAMNRGDRLLDLVWAWSWIAEGKVTSKRASVIEYETRTHCTQMFSKGPVSTNERRRLEPVDMQDLVDALHDERRLRRAGFPNGPRPDSKNHVDSLVVEYLTSSDVFRRSKETVWVNPEPEA